MRGLMAFDETYDEPEYTEVLVKSLDPGHPVELRYAHAGDAGADLVAAEDVTLKPFQRALVPTGMAIALPAGYVALVHPRSGLAVKYGVTVLNAPGTIDAGYRGEVKVPLINLDPEHTMEFHRGDRIAQLVIQRYVEARFVPASTLPGSDRAERGFGSTGVSSCRTILTDGANTAVTARKPRHAGDRSRRKMPRMLFHSRRVGCDTKYLRGRQTWPTMKPSIMPPACSAARSATTR